jgi:heavy metal sensor kinase
VVGRLPIRLRLTLAFAVAMAAVLTAVGAFLYVRLGDSLDEALDEGLQTRAAEVVGLVRSGTGGDGARTALVDQDERFVQVLDIEGRVVAATPRVAERPLLGPEELADVDAGGAERLERGGVPGVAGLARLFALPFDGPGGRLVVVVGASLEERDEALSGLLAELAVAGPVALVLASLAGYAVARQALRPVDEMRAEAAAISASEPGRRLPLPRADDELRRLGETLNDMLDRLEEALERERRFVADASHELRTPLALLQAELEVALRRPRSAAELEAALRSAATEAQRLVRLAEDLLVLARSDRGGLPLVRTPAGASELLGRVADRFRGAAEAAGTSVEVVDGAGLVVSADAARVEQALGNLVDNALRHGRGPVRLCAVERDGRVELHVADSGDGFPPEFLPHAFERFSRADPARSGGGAGLGLAIAEVVARAHGGTAHAENRENGGADVWLSLPAA